MRVVILDAFQALEDLAPQWRNLLDRAFWTSVFSTPEWLLGWWRVFGEGRADRRLLVWTLVDEKGGLLGLFPLYVERWGLVRWLRPLGRPKFADMSGIIADRDRAAEVHRQFFAWLAACSDWDVVRLDNVPLASLPSAAMPEEVRDPSFWADCLRENGLASVFRPAEPCMVVSLTGRASVEDLFRSSSASRYRRKLRKLDKHFARVEVRQVAATPENVRLAREFSERKSRAFRDGRSFFNAPGAEDFILAQVGAEEALGLRFFVLYLDGAAAAYEFVYQRDGALLIYFRAFDQDYNVYSPGYCLLCRIIDRCLEQGDIRELNLLLGGEAYKHVFSPRAVEQFTCTLYNQNLRARLCRIGHGAFRLAKRVRHRVRHALRRKAETPPAPTAPSPSPKS